MPPYCIVCNRDLAMDQTSSPPYCGTHARERMDKAGIANLPSCVLYISGQPQIANFGSAHRRLDRKTFPGTFRLIVDKLSPQGETVERAIISDISVPLMFFYFEDSSWRHDDTYHFSIPDDSPLFAEISRLHSQLVSEGWRPVYESFRSYKHSSGEPAPSVISFHAHPANQQKWLSWDDLMDDFSYRLNPNVDEFYLWNLTRGVPPRFNLPAEKKKRFGIF